VVEIALIPPGSLVKRACHYRAYQMALAGELNGHPETEYAQFYSLYKRPVGKYWIMDNGAWEGMTVSLEELFGLTAAYGMSEVVAPDVLNDPEKTYIQTYHYLSKLSHQTYPNVAVVAHGRTIEEAQEFIYRIDELCDPRVKTVMIGRAFSRTVGNPTARYLLADWVKVAFGSRYDIHLLGFNDAWGPDELIACRDIVRSMDTAMPFIETLYGININDPQSQGAQRPRPKDYFSLQPGAFNSTLLQQNIETLDIWAGKYHSV
jgi:hypothetical protein